MAARVVVGNQDALDEQLLYTVIPRRRSCSDRSFRFESAVDMA